MAPEVRRLAAQEHPCSHEKAIDLEDAGKYGSRVPTDWKWCQECGAVSSTGGRIWNEIGTKAGT